MNLYNNIYISRFIYLINDVTQSDITSKEIPELTRLLNQILKGEDIAPSAAPTSLERKVGLIQDNILSWKNALINNLALSYLNFNIEEVIRRKLDELHSLQTDLQRHSGELWECIGKRESPFGGFIYRFAVKDECFDDFSIHPDYLKREENIRKKSEDILPALEMTPLTAAAYFMKDSEQCSAQLERIAALKEESSPIEGNLDSFELQFDDTLLLVRIKMEREAEQGKPPFSEIGCLAYVDDRGQLIMELPDREALLKGWKNLQREYPERALPDMDIVSSEGVADDLSFTQAYFRYDALLSNGQEFLHDYSSHICSLIIRMWKGRERYLEEKDRLRKSIEPFFQFVLNAKKMCEEPSGLENTPAEFYLS